MECISSHSADDAPDVLKTATIGGLDCHYALMGNLNPSHPEQQDRAAIYALPVKVKPEAFKAIIEDVFAAMRQKIVDLKKNQR